MVRPESHTDLVSRAVDPNDLASMALQQELLHAWCSLLGLSAPAHGQLTVSVDDQAKVLVVPSIEHAMQGAKQAGGTPNVFVAGSLHLVGGVMAHLQTQGLLDDRLASAPA